MWRFHLGCSEKGWVLNAGKAYHAFVVEVGKWEVLIRMEHGRRKSGKEGTTAAGAAPCQKINLGPHLSPVVLSTPRSSMPNESGSDRSHVRRDHHSHSPWKEKL